MDLLRLALPVVLAALAGALSAAPAFAEEGDLPPTTQFFETFDTNADGVVTGDEFKGSQEVFKLLDVDKDGRISAPELGLPADYKPRPKRSQDTPRGTEPAPRRDRARRGAGRMAERIEQMDTDGDGKVGPEEWRGPEGSFERFDRNDDGFVDAADLERMGAGRRTMDPARARARFDRVDADGNGEIGKDEVPARLAERLEARDAAWFDAADQDGSGGLDLAEYQGLVAALFGGGGGDARRRRGLREGALKRFDTNGDGQVTRDEFPGSDAAFDRYDRNKDGVLTAADLETKPAAAPETPRAPKGPVTESGSLIKTMDVNGDGKVDRGEFTGSDEDWKRHDRDGNGWITPDEVGEAPQPHEPAADAPSDK